MPEKGSVASRVTVWTFDNRWIPIQERQDKQSRIETALNITIADIRQEQGKRHILFYAVSAKSDLPDFIPWKGSYLSRDEFVLTLGEGIMGPVTIDLANIPCPFRRLHMCFDEAALLELLTGLTEELEQ